MATKTETEIEKDIYRLIKQGAVAAAIGGTLYRRGQRPRNAKTEDAVVSFLSGTEGQEQTGVVQLNIYVPRITAAMHTDPVQDIHRVEELEQAVITAIEDCEDTEYLLTLDGTPRAYDVEDIDQTYINARIHYRRKTF